jgi:hypothetical protein
MPSIINRKKILNTAKAEVVNRIEFKSKVNRMFIYLFQCLFIYKKC